MDITLAEIAPAFAGGLLIGLGAALLLLFNDKIAGISGIFDNVLHGSIGDAGWRWAFLAGLLLPAWLLGAAPTTFDRGLLGMSLAGLLVGFGTQLGSGCTSGHGVCGIANFSPRSAAATCTFMLTAMLTVAVIGYAT